MAHDTRARWTLLCMLGIAGTMLGHAAGYLAAHPNPAARLHVLSASGHGYWEAGLWAALVGASFALFSVFLAGRTSGADAGGGGTWWHLALVQMTLFAAVEVLERVAHGAPADVFAEPAFLFGLPLQILVAAVAAWFLGLALKAGAATRRRSTGLATPERDVPLRPCNDRIPASTDRRARSARAPPSFLAV